MTFPSGGELNSFRKYSEQQTVAEKEYLGEDGAL
jgi:hypothetical protein